VVGDDTGLARIRTYVHRIVRRYDGRRLELRTPVLNCSRMWNYLKQDRVFHSHWHSAMVLGMSVGEHTVSGVSCPSVEIDKVIACHEQPSLPRNIKHDTKCDAGNRRCVKSVGPMSIAIYEE